jgi:hypothetical protein
MYTFHIKRGSTVGQHTAHTYILPLLVYIMCDSPQGTNDARVYITPVCLTYSS